MLIADQFECTIPGTDAVKDAVVSCAGNLPVPSDPAIVLATWATAAGTILLAVFAALAWIVSRHQVRIALENNQVQIDALREEAQKDRKHSRSALSIQALSRYVEELTRLTDGNNMTPLGETGVGEARNTGVIWRLHHRTTAAHMATIEAAERALLRYHTENRSVFRWLNPVEGPQANQHHFSGDRKAWSRWIETYVDLLSAYEQEEQPRGTLMPAFEDLISEVTKKLEPPKSKS